MSAQTYGRIHGYEPYLGQPGYGRYTERTVFDYSDRRDGARYGDRPLESVSRPQVVDYNHGSLSSAKSADDRGAETERDRPEPVDSGRDDYRERVRRTEPQQTVYRSVQEDAARPSTALDADVDIKFIQDTIVRIFTSISLELRTHFRPPNDT